MIGCSKFDQPLGSIRHRPSRARSFKRDFSIGWASLVSTLFTQLSNLSLTNAFRDDNWRASRSNELTMFELFGARGEESVKNEGKFNVFNSFLNTRISVLNPCIRLFNLKET